MTYDKSSQNVQTAPLSIARKSRSGYGLLGAALILLGYILLRNMALLHDDHVDRVERLERQLLSELYGGQVGLEVSSEWVIFPMEVGSACDGFGDCAITSNVEFKAHYLYSHLPIPNQASDQVTEDVNSNNEVVVEQKKPQLMLLHGYGTTSSLCWRNVLARLSQKYDVWALDVPGFGRSSGGTGLLGDMTSGETLSMYCNFFKEFQERVGLASPYVVAHSFGGFLFTHCASRYPSLSSNTLLADVPGFFPNNGGLDYVFSFYFSFGLPQSILRKFFWGEFGEQFLHSVAKVVDLKWSKTQLSYWHELHMSKLLQSGQVVSKFVVFKYLFSNAVDVALVPLMNFTTPVHLLYGENDPISPVHQGHFVSNLADGLHVSNLFVLPGTGHMPFLAKTRDLFVDMVLEADESRYYGKAAPLALNVEPAAGKIIHPSVVASCLHDRAMEWATYSCLPFTFLSNLNRENMYKAVRNIKDACLERSGEN
jgi:pimeloyl-ACP methyl ester carboxylesterase